MVRSTQAPQLCPKKCLEKVNKNPALYFGETTLIFPSNFWALLNMHTGTRDLSHFLTIIYSCPLVQNN